MSPIIKLRNPESMMFTKVSYLIDTKILFLLHNVSIKAAYSVSEVESGQLAERGACLVPARPGPARSSQ